MSEDALTDTEQQTRFATCPNCGAKIEGPWCHQCGQNQKGINRFFLSLLNEAFEDVFSLNSRTAKTLFNLLFRPGFLTTEYLAGRRARYLPPLRLYLVTSVIFFSYLSLQSYLSQDAPPGFMLSSDPQQVGKEAAKAEAHVPAGKGPVNAPEASEASEFELELPWLTEEDNKALENKLKTQIDKAERNPREFSEALFDLAPPILFVILPLFAVLLKVSYIGSRRYYSEHLLLAVHNHSFLFVALLADQFLEALAGTIAAPVANSVRTALQIWIVVYMYLSLRQVYQEGYLITAVKFVFLFVVYQIFFIIALLAALFWELMSL